jgi:transposase
MPPSITLQAAERNTLLGYYRHHADPAVRLRAHIILLLADGHAWATITAVLYCSTATIARWQARFLQGRIPALAGQPRGQPRRLRDAVRNVLLYWVTDLTPRTFGFLRSRWTCALAALLLRQTYGLRVSAETIRRRLHEADLVWCRPRPVLRPTDPNREAILAELRYLLSHLPADETAVWEDEVDINTNPKLGAMWMPKGHQEAVETPGTNEKRYLAGSLSWRTGALVYTLGSQRDGELFVRHLDDLRRHLRRYRVIHVLCDNARFHQALRCRKVQAYLKRWGHRIQLHYLPKYAPETNPMERLWWHLHDEITRNHRCQTMAELLDQVFRWLGDGTPFPIEGSVYPKPLPP